MKCKICDSPSSFVFKGTVLFKYSVAYFRCSECGFIQTEEPFWLHEAYKDSISIYDVGVLSRALDWRTLTGKVIQKLFDPNGRFVDYGGGTGLFVRAMRDNGFDFWRYDPYSANIFARGFDVSDMPSGKDSGFEMVTALEVFEHLPDPMGELDKILRLSDSVLFSTYVQPHPAVTPRNWSYFALEGGQHIAFYTLDALRTMAVKANMNFYTNRMDAHLLTKKNLNISSDGFIDVVRRAKGLWRLRQLLRRFRRPYGRPALTESDQTLIYSRMRQMAELPPPPPP